MRFTTTDGKEHFVPEICPFCRLNTAGKHEWNCPNNPDRKEKGKKMKKLTIGDFTRKGIEGSFGHYFSHILPDGREVCLESCLNGYDVAIYDREGGNLIGEKVCTNIDGMMESQILSGFSLMSGEALEKAVEIANEMLMKK